MVIASDGVFEFLENNECVDLISKFFEENNLESACDRLLEEAHARWTSEDDSIVDDITFILIYFKHNEE